MVPAVLAARALVAAGAAVAAGEAPSAVAGDTNSLYVAVSGVVVALITSGAVIYNSRNSKSPPPPTPFLLDDEFTDNLTGLYRDAEHRAAKAEISAEMWKARAKLAGWSEEQE